MKHVLTHTEIQIIVWIYI